MTIGICDGAEVFEIAGIYMLNVLSKNVLSKTILDSTVMVDWPFGKLKTSRNQKEIKKRSENI